MRSSEERSFSGESLEVFLRRHASTPPDAADGLEEKALSELSRRERRRRARSSTLWAAGVLVAASALVVFPWRPLGVNTPEDLLAEEILIDSHFSWEQTDLELVEVYGVWDDFVGALNSPSKPEIP